ncbi:hydroxysteroid dehydrogenase-like protein 2 isoform X2 [Chanos chanos]|uniref:Hydroxysteroid dehydrogenase-like protein 2 n=1 Tax=Chanos chanos TaxID=29144 RepID=A0A6J2UYZ8_CHACN|nr:hydroxysteroid dehydrogenase-like protein 2 isoform X2 [Chanos chanos]
MLQNTGKLAGCTMFITGASRGIGKAIALKAAKDGANVVIAAKTAEAHPKLPGTIYTAAEEIEAAGGKALPCIVDVRDEKQINDAVEQAVQKFGAYTMAKYGMSMCVLGMAEEFRGSVAVNALWPKTAIQTAAMDMLGGSGVGKQCRKVEIMADAAYAIFNKPLGYTGHFAIDEDILKKEGIQDFDIYAVEPGHPLLPDFFLDDEPEELVKKMEDHGANPIFKSGKTSESSSSGPIAETFNVIKGILSPDIVKSTQGVYKFDLSGEHSGVWYIDLKNDAGSAGMGEPPVKADVVMSMDSGDFIKMFAGKLKPTMAFMSGKLKIKGDMTLAIKMEKMMSMMKKSKL